MTRGHFPRNVRLIIKRQGKGTIDIISHYLLTKENCMIISTNAQKSTWQNAASIPNVLNLSRSEIEANFCRKIPHVYKTSATNIIIHGERLNIFSLRAPSFQSWDNRRNRISNIVLTDNPKYKINTQTHMI